MPIGVSLISNFDERETKNWNAVNRDLKPAGNKKELQLKLDSNENFLDAPYTVILSNITNSVLYYEAKDNLK